MKYMVINADKNWDNEDIVEFNVEKDAIEYAQGVFNSMRNNKYDVENTGYLAVVESANPDEESVDHYDYNPVDKYIIDGEIVFLKKNWAEIEEYFQKKDNDIRFLSDPELVYMIDTMPDWSYLENYDVENELEERTSVRRFDYIDDPDFDKEWFIDDFHHSECEFDNINQYFDFYYPMPKDFKVFLSKYVGRTYNVSYDFEKFISDAVKELS